MKSLVQSSVGYLTRKVLTGLSMAKILNRYEQMEMLSKVVSWPQLYHILNNYRLFEYAWVLQKLALISREKHIKILDVGSGKSGFVNVLCATGYYVDGVDKYSPPFHNYPTYKFIRGDILSLDPRIKYDVITCISTVEHIGLNWGNEHDDILAVEKMNELLTPGGTLLLTTHYGRDYVVNKELAWRIYDDEHLGRLLAPGRISEIQFFSKPDGFWLPTSREDARVPQLDSSDIMPRGNVNVVLTKKWNAKP